MTVLGLSGSLRRDSHNTRLLHGAGELLAPATELVVFERLGEIPPYNEDTEHDPPEAVAELKAAIASADAVLVATPEYNASIPGVLKNALDWVSRPRAHPPLQGKPAAVIGAGPRLFGAVWAQAEARKVLSSTGARVVDRELPIGQADEALGGDGLPLERDAREALSATLDELLELAAARSPVAARAGVGRVSRSRGGAGGVAAAGRAPRTRLGTMIEDLVEQIETRFAELGEQMTDPEVISDRERYAEAGRAYSQLEPAAKLAAEWRRAQDDAAGAEELLSEMGEDAELREELGEARASASRSSRRRSAWRWSSATPTTRRA